MINRRTFFSQFSVAAAAGAVCAAAAPFQTPAPAAASDRPNVVMIYADDVGYGDLSCYGAYNVKTPNLDRLARAGIRFTDAHSSAATCTPSRYSLLTGEYSFRLSKARVLPGDAPLLIEPGRQTLASIFRDKGYRTAAIGKWHLGLGNGKIDWNAEIKPGPLELGFDECFLIPATGDRVPCVYVENHKVAALDPADPITVSYEGPVEDGGLTGKANPEKLKLHPSHGHDMTIVNGVSRIGYMKGGKSALWVDEDIADTITNRAAAFIDRNARSQQPFFLYFATHDIHVPRLPHPRFDRASTMGPRGNAIAELDWSVGQIMAALRKHGLERNTMVVFSSDNGPVVDDGYKDDAVAKLFNHKPAGPYRGGKYSSFEAGTRVPLIVRWPARIKGGAVSSALVGQTDFLKSFAALLDVKVDAKSAPDGANILPALLGDSKVGRSHLVEQAGGLTLRAGKWKYIEPNKGAKMSVPTNTELGNDPQPQLYDLAADPGEKKNMAAAMPGKLQEMQTVLKRIRDGEFVP
ncbi:MAG: arylsulfatase [Acidobacteria bacterium]|nr:arylsulfatase [Acidobacteriota bacterium]